MTFICYPKCTTCQKARKWLESTGLPFDARHIKDNPPTAGELRDWYGRGGLPLKKFFNTSGVLYKNLNLKDKLPQMSEQEQLELLASDGMLVKRPLLVMEDRVLPGFKPETWAEALK